MGDESAPEGGFRARNLDFRAPPPSGGPGGGFPEPKQGGVITPES